MDRLAMNTTLDRPWRTLVGNGKQIRVYLVDGIVSTHAPKHPEARTSGTALLFSPRRMRT